MPPTERWPFSCTIPCFSAPLRNSPSSASLASLNGTFMGERSSLTTTLLKKLLEPFEHQARDIDRVGGAGVEHRVGLGLRLVVHYRWRALLRLADEIVAHDDEGQPGRPGVLLRAGV